jgi:hypothetical protein
MQNKRVEMNAFCKLACAALLLATVAPPAVSCTQEESELKMREAIYAVHDINARNPAKAESAAKKINQAMNETLARSANGQTPADRLCQALDEVLAELRR